MKAQTGTGDTALTYACENGHTDVAEVLLDHGADLVCCNVYFISSCFYALLGEDKKIKIKKPTA